MERTNQMAKSMDLTSQHLDDCSGGGASRKEENALQTLSQVDANGLAEHRSIDNKVLPPSMSSAIDVIRPSDIDHSDGSSMMTDGHDNVDEQIYAPEID